MNTSRQTRGVTGSPDSVRGQVFLLVGSRVGDDVLVAARPGRPGFSGSPGSIQTYRFGCDRVQPLDVVSEAIRFGGSLVDPEAALIHVLDEVSANRTYYPPAMRGGGGDIVTYRIDQDGRLQPIDRTLALGARPTQLSFAAQRRFVVQANRGAGRDGGGPCTTAEFDANGHLYPRIHSTEHSVVCRRRNIDGTLGDVADVFTTDPSYVGGFVAVVCDPADHHQIACYTNDGWVRLLRVDPHNGKLVEVFASEMEEGRRDIDTAAGSVAFHPAGRWLYARLGLSPRILLIDCNSPQPHVVGTFDAGPTTAAMRMSEPAQTDIGFERGTLITDSDGRHLYVAVSIGNDPQTGAIAVFRLNPPTGRATPIQILHHPPGASPGCGLDIAPTGRHLAVPCPRSDEVLIFDIGPDGLLSYRYGFEQTSAAYARFYSSPAESTGGRAATS